MLSRESIYSGVKKTDKITMYYNPKSLSKMFRLLKLQQRQISPRAVTTFLTTTFFCSTLLHADKKDIAHCCDANSVHNHHHDQQHHQIPEIKESGIKSTVNVIDRDDDVDIENDHGEFDVYLKKVTESDLVKLFRQYQDGLNVWPWIWTQHNDNGPHHVFVGTLSNEHLDQIIDLKRKVPNLNVLVITDTQSVEGLRGGISSLYELECGVVLDTKVKLTDYDNKMIMLEDERIICFTKLYVS